VDSPEFKLAGFFTELQQILSTEQSWTPQAMLYSVSRIAFSKGSP